MNTGVLLITHGRLGHELLETLFYMAGDDTLHAEALAVDSDRKGEDLEAEAQACLARLDTGDGVLVLTDLIGATPANLASRLNESGNVRVVAGVNLPMLVRVMNYRALPLQELAMKALSGGRDGIIQLFPLSSGDT